MDDQYYETRRLQIGHNIKVARLRMQMTQRELARYLDCSRAHINRVERGLAELKVTQLEQVSRISNTPIEFLLYGEGYPRLNW